METQPEPWRRTPAVASEGAHVVPWQAPRRAVRSRRERHEQAYRRHELKSFGIHLIVASVAFALVLALGAGARDARALGASLSSWPPPLRRRLYEASGRILELHVRFWPVTLVSLIGVALAAGWLGRRITGPLVRFTASSSASAAGEFPEPVQLALHRLPRARGGRAQRADHRAEGARGGAGETRGARSLATLEELSERVREAGQADAIELAERALEQMKGLDGHSS